MIFFLIVESCLKVVLFTPNSSLIKGHFSNALKHNFKMLPLTSCRKVTNTTHECQALSCDDYDIKWTALTDGETQAYVECETRATFSKW